MEEKIRLGISSCLLGNNVRWNAGHQRDRFLTDTLGKFVDYVPVYPEVEARFGIPRESMRLVGDPENPRLITFKSKKDHTDIGSPGTQNHCKKEYQCITAHTGLF